MEIQWLNHASVIIAADGIRLLTDPWFWGTCFEEGWGLRFENTEALEKAAGCTHIWVSHFHQDHFHRPTLQKILELNPSIIFIGNHSYNFQLDEAARKLGFTHIVSFAERTPLLLNDKFTITRYPTTGIDNMLLIQTTDGVILNYNDCSLPAWSQKKIKKKIGAIDFLLSNFNHAGKLLLYPYPTPERIKEKLKQSFADNYAVFDPAHILPFASHHYYRAPESFKQNEAMLTTAELSPLDERIIGWQMGDCIHYHDKQLVVRSGHIAQARIPDMLTRQKGHTAEAILQAANAFIRLIKSRNGVFTRFLPSLLIEITDAKTIIKLHPAKGAFVHTSQSLPHIQAHSSALYKWFTTPYGTDSFVVGAHFDIVSANRLPLKWQMVLGLLVDNKLDIRSAFGMLLKRKGRRFLYNRREEILGILFSFRIAASYHKDD